MRKHRSTTSIHTRRAFTLVEMLIAVALVLLMMVLFANVFQIATGSIGKMRGLAENDQRARSLQTTIKADLDKRTFRWVYPFAANENVGALSSNIGRRQGYFYISENNPHDQLDDVLQFTVSSTVTIRNTDTTPYYGQALTLAPFTFPNQPDTDDAQLVPNDTGLSTVGEVVYFVRNGSLYRRQLLVREPLVLSGATPQPTDGTVPNPAGNNVFAYTYPAGVSPAFQYASNGPFWRDFDYSAVLTSNGATFAGSDWLDNSAAASVSLGNPAMRFGFSPANFAKVTPGVPKEFLENTATATAANCHFFGRFTLQECSDTNFIYPQNVTSGATGNIIPTDPSAALAFNATGQAIQGFDTGSRRGEDLILANVHAFDITVWDETVGNFVNIGDPSLSALNSSDYGIGARYATNLPVQTPSPTYGPRLTENSSVDAINAVFDTWHPQIDLNGGNNPGSLVDPLTGQTRNDDPPYRPLVFKPQSITGNSSDVAAWQPSTSTYFLGQVVFPSGPPGSTTPISAKMPYGAPFFYRCVQVGTVPTGLNEPTWPQVNGMTVVDGTAVSPLVPYIWQAVDNRKPLKAIRLQIRFVDPSSQQMRQLTIIHSLVD